MLLIISISLNLYQYINLQEAARLQQILGEGNDVGIVVSDYLLWKVRVIFPCFGVLYFSTSYTRVTITLWACCIKHKIQGFYGAKTNCLWYQTSFSLDKSFVGICARVIVEASLLKIVLLTGGSVRIYIDIICIAKGLTLLYSYSWHALFPHSTSVNSLHE